MSIAADNRKVAFEALLEVDGECLIVALGDRTVTGLVGVVNKGFDPAKRAKHAVDFDDRTMSQIEIVKNRVLDEIACGWTFRDECGAFHRIETIRSTDFTQIFECVMTEPDTDE